mmetsp:Transcript_36473/g.88383  ORF Transcript_36473/g.88383 Transcript_36473/m.88383 type:complete len:994 (+) Transcript_36473:112-3093(+)
MSRLARYIEESSSEEESSVEDKYDATSFGSQFDSDSSDSDDEPPFKGRYSYESDQESEISLTPGEEYVLDTLFGWMDRPICAASQTQSLLLESARASALQNISANRTLYLKAHAENSHHDDSDSDSDSFITQEVEEYSEGPEQSYSEAQDAKPAPSNFSEEDNDMEDDESPQKEGERVQKEEVGEPKQSKRSKRERKVKPSVANPIDNEQEPFEADDIDLFNSESKENGSHSDEIIDQQIGSEDDTSAAHRVSFLKTVLKKKERKGKNEGVPSNVFEPPSKKTSKAAARKDVPVEVKMSGKKAADVPADVQVVASSKKAHSKIPRKSAEASPEKLSEIPFDVPLEVSIELDAETTTTVPAEIQTKSEKPSPINVDEIRDEMLEMEVEKTPSLESLAAKIAQQRNTPRNRSNRDPTPTRREARSISMEETDVTPEPDQQVQDQQVQEIIETDLAASREPPVGYSPRSPHVKKTKENEGVREPRRNSRPDPTDVPEPVVHSEPVVVKEETRATAVRAEPKTTRAQRLSSKKKSKKKRVSDVHPGQPRQEGEVQASPPVEEVGPVKSITVDELKESLSELSHPRPQQDQSRVKEESLHTKVPSDDPIDTEQSNVQTQSPQQVEQQQLPSKDTMSPSNRNMEPVVISIEEALARRKSQERSAPMPHSPSKRRYESSRATQDTIQYAPPLPTNNEDNPIDIEEYMAQREMLNREAPRLSFSGSTAVRTTESPTPVAPVAVREESETPRQPPSPRISRVPPQVAPQQHSGVADLPGASNGYPYGKLPKQRNYDFGTERPRQTSSHRTTGLRQPKQFDALARNDPAGHIIDHQYDTKKRSKKSSSGRSKSNLASIEDLKKLEKRIEEHFRNSYTGENDNRSTVSTKELRKLERQLVLQLRRVEEKRAAKLERLRSKKKSSRHRQDIVEAEVLAVEPKDEANHPYSTPQKAQHSKKKSADFRDANRFEQLQALRMSKEMGRYMSKQSGHAASDRHVQGQAY